MKIKIFALIMAILCLTMLFAACSKKVCKEHVDEDKNAICDVCEEELDCEEHNDENVDFICDVCGDKFNVTFKCVQHIDEDTDEICDVCGGDYIECTEHKDLDANKRCDACNAGIVTITQLEKPVEEKRVPMVVNPMPTDAAIADYIQTTPVQKNNYDGYADYIWSGAVQDGRFVYGVSDTSVIIYDTELAKEIYSVNSNNVNVTMHEYWFTVDSYDSMYTREYYTYSGAKFASVTDTNAFGTTVEVNNPDIYRAIAIEGTVYVVNCNTNTVINSEQESTFLDRPFFGVYNSKVGVSSLNGSLYFYDLGEWLKCTASYQVPSYADGADVWMLDNGKVLLQYSVLLNNNAASFDFIDSEGYKRDIVYVVVNPADGQAKNIEFGYVIMDVEAIDDDNDVYNTRVDLNRVVVYPIVNDRVDSYAKTVILTDSDLNIKLNETNAFGGGTFDFELIAPKRFLVDRYYSNNQSRRELLNEKGEFIAYVPLTAEIREENIEFEGKLYDFDMKLIEQGATT